MTVISSLPYATKKKSYCKQEIIDLQHPREEGARHLNCNKVVGYQQDVLLVRTVSMGLGLLGSLWHLQLGSSPRQGVEHPDTSWATVASAWLEFCHNLRKMEGTGQRQIQCHHFVVTGHLLFLTHGKAGNVKM